jgi:hypothetical protein
MWWISVILMTLAGIFNACMDVIRTRYDTSIFRFWKNQKWVDPALSWTNKWKPDSKLGDLIMSTVLVWVTDLWHFAKMLMILCFVFAIVFYMPFMSWWIDAFMLYIAFTGTFELFYAIIFINKKS